MTGLPEDPVSTTGRRRKTVRLKDVAEHLDLSPATVSLVLNRSPVARAIPRETHDRVHAAVAELGYRPNLLARSLRQSRSHTIGVLVPEISEGYAAEITQGLEEHLRAQGYLHLLASHRSRPELLDDCLHRLQDHSVEGFVVLAARLETPPDLPTVAISGDRRVDGVANVVLDEALGARLALGHLAELGHESIAFFRGPRSNVDAESRWRSIEEAAAATGIEIRPRLVRETEGVSYGEVFYRQGHALATELVETSPGFTALYAFNDISAIGAIRGILDAGLRVPEDVSVIGFDDIEVASFFNPSLTTVRQPLRRMGETAARILLETLTGNPLPREVRVEPELIVRASTGPVRLDRSGRG